MSSEVPTSPCIGTVHHLFKLTHVGYEHVDQATFLHKGTKNKNRAVSFHGVTLELHYHFQQFLHFILICCSFSVNCIFLHLVLQVKGRDDSMSFQTPVVMVR